MHKHNSKKRVKGSKPTKGAPFLGESVEDCCMMEARNMAAAVLEAVILLMASAAKTNSKVNKSHNKKCMEQQSIRQAGYLLSTDC